MQFKLKLMPVALILTLIAASPVLASDTNLKKKAKKSKDQVKVEKAIALALEDDNDETLATRQAQQELDQTEKFLNEKNPAPVKKHKSVAVAKVETGSPQLLDQLGNVDSSQDEADREASTRSLGPSVPASQALNDFQDAQKTLKDVKVEWRAKTSHVKTKEEIKQEKDESAYRVAIMKVTKQNGRQKGKPQFVQTAKGKVKVVFIDENEFVDSKPEPVSSQLSQAVKDVGREPASIDDQIDSATQQ